MKTIYKLTLDGTYTSITKIEVENDRYKDMLEDSPDEYFKTMTAAKKEALKEMTRILEDWKYAVKYMRELKEQDIETQRN